MASSTRSSSRTAMTTNKSSPTRGRRTRKKLSPEKSRIKAAANTKSIFHYFSPSKKGNDDTSKCSKSKKVTVTGDSSNKSRSKTKACENLATLSSPSSKRKKPAALSSLDTNTINGQMAVNRSTKKVKSAAMESASTHSSTKNSTSSTSVSSTSFIQKIKDITEARAAISSNHPATPSETFINVDNDDDEDGADQMRMALIHIKTNTSYLQDICKTLCNDRSENYEQKEKGSESSPQLYELFPNAIIGRNAPKSKKIKKNKVPVGIPICESGVSREHILVKSINPVMDEDAMKGFAQKYSDSSGEYSPQYLKEAQELCSTVLVQNKGNNAVLVSKARISSSVNGQDVLTGYLSQLKKDGSIILKVGDAIIFDGFNCEQPKQSEKEKIATPGCKYVYRLVSILPKVMSSHLKKAEHKKTKSVEMNSLYGEGKVEIASIEKETPMEEAKSDNSIGLRTMESNEEKGPSKNTSTVNDTVTVASSSLDQSKKEEPVSEAKSDDNITVKRKENYEEKGPDEPTSKIEDNALNVSTCSSFDQSKKETSMSEATSENSNTTNQMKCVCKEGLGASAAITEGDTTNESAVERDSEIIEKKTVEATERSLMNSTPTYITRRSTRRHVRDSQPTPNHAEEFPETSIENIGAPDAMYSPENPFAALCHDSPPPQDEHMDMDFSQDSFFDMSFQADSTNLNGPIKAEINAALANSCWRALNSTEVHNGFGILSHLESAWNVCPSDHLAESLSQFLLHGPENEGTRFREAFRTELASTYMEKAMSKFVHDGKRNKIGLQTENELEELLTMPVKELEACSDSKMAMSKIYQISQGLQFYSRSLGYVAKSISTELEDIIAEKVPPTLKILIDLEFASLFLRSDIRQSLKTVTKSVISCLICHGHWLLGSPTEGHQTPKNCHEQKCAKEFQIMITAFGVILSHVAWLYCAREDLNFADQSCCYLINDLISSELASMDFSTLSKKKLSIKKKEKFKKDIKIRFLFALDTKFSSQLQINLASLMNLREEATLILGKQ